MPNPYLEEAVAKEGTKTSNGLVLCILAASGQAFRWRGVFFVMNYKDKSDGKVYKLPAVLLKDGTPLALDPRSVVFDDGNLAMLWTPRPYIADMTPAGVQWLNSNPNVFDLPIGAKMTTMNPENTHVRIAGISGEGRSDAGPESPTRRAE